MARGSIVTRETRHGKRYDITLWVEGKRHYKTFKRLKDAEAYLDEFSIDAREGTFRELNEGTFRQYCEIWKTKYLIPEELKVSTIGVYNYLLDHHLIERFGRRPVTSIGTSDITTFRSELLRDKQSPASVRKIMGLLSRIFDDAIEDQYLRTSPMPTRKRKADKSGERARRGRALTPDQAQLLLAECEGDDDLHLVVLTGLLAGLRRGEIFALDWPSIDFDKDIIHVRHSLHWAYGRHYERPDDARTKAVIHTPKTAGSLRDVDLNPELKKELRSYLKTKNKAGFGLIFKSREGGPIDPGNFIARKFHPAVERAIEKAKKAKDEAAVKALDGLHFHDTRHTFGSWLVAQGEDILYVSAQMGHARPSITADVYSHLLKARRPDAARKMANLLFGSKAAVAAE